MTNHKLRILPTLTAEQIDICELTVKQNKGTCGNRERLHTASKREECIIKYGD